MAGGFPEYDHFDGMGLAELVKRREISPAELLEEAVSRIERLNPHLNAVIHPLYDQAREQVHEHPLKGAFAGVPFLLKDLLAAYAGAPLTMGSKAYRHYVPAHDSELVRRFKASGVLILGKTNTPEFGLMGITEPELHGPTHNPWNPDHTPGGSSGGSAAAVAAGMVPLASGGDGGGSIRIPASHCGLFGLKPTRGRNPTGPDFGQIWQGAAVEHVITRSVRDSAAMLDVTQGETPGAPYMIAPPERPFLGEVGAAPGRLRIALNTASPLGKDVHPECIQAAEEAACMLTDLGHVVEEARPPIDGLTLAQSYFTMYFGEMAADIHELERTLGRKARPGDVEATTWVLSLLGRSVSAGEFVRALREWDRAARAMGSFLGVFDLYLTPTTAAPPVRIGELAPSAAQRALLTVVNTLGLGHTLKALGLVEGLASDSLEKTPFTQLANMTGLPAMSVPLHWTPQGLPVGVHFTGRFGDEATLLRLAAQLEQAFPWFDRRPALTG